MKIRQVRKSDIEKVKELADALIVKSPDSDKVFGFYDYSLKLEQYSTRAESSFFIVAESKTNLEGFCMAYDSEFVRKLREKEPLLDVDNVFLYLAKLGKPYVYVDEFAVRVPRSFVGSGVAYNLREVITSKTRKADIPLILCAITHNPWKNISAINFVKKSGCNLVQEVENQKGILLGVYQLNL